MNRSTKPPSGEPTTRAPAADPATTFRLRVEVSGKGMRMQRHSRRPTRRCAQLAARDVAAGGIPMRRVEPMGTRVAIVHALMTRESKAGKVLEELEVAHGTVRTAAAWRISVVMRPTAGLRVLPAKHGPIDRVEPPVEGSGIALRGSAAIRTIEPAAAAAGSVACRTRIGAQSPAGRRAPRSLYCASP